jgi:hypothetical protein
MIVKCTYCGHDITPEEEIEAEIRLGAFIYNMHTDEKGRIEKCYTKRKFPFSFIFGKRNYKGVTAVLKTSNKKADFE